MPVSPRPSHLRPAQLRELGLFLEAHSEESIFLLGFLFVHELLSKGYKLMDI
jgi:hypothetical protein